MPSKENGPLESAAPAEKIRRAYVLKLCWIDSKEETPFEVQEHYEQDNAVFFRLNDRRDRVVTVPFSNLKWYEVDRG